MCARTDAALGFPLSGGEAGEKVEAASNVAVVLLSCCTGEVSCPTSVNCSRLLSRLQLLSCSRLLATVTCSFPLG